MMKLTTEQRITKQVIKLMNDPRFIALSGIFMVGKRTVSDKEFVMTGGGPMPMTAATNGRDEVYGRAFVDGLNDAQLRFLIAHENFHKMLMHPVTFRQLKYPMIGNMAMDFVINGELDNIAGEKADKFLEMIKGGCLDHKYDGLDTLAVYKLLLQEYPPQGGGKGQKGQPGQGTGGQTLDHHDFEDPTDGSGEGEDGEDGDGEGSGVMRKLTAEELKEAAADIDKALRQGAMMAGKGGGNLPRVVGEMMQAQVDWRAALQEYITEMCSGGELSTWRRASRRSMASGNFMPSKYDETLRRLTIGIDTSGSISQADITAFMSEVKCATESCHPEVCDVIYWDDGVAKAEVYEGEDVKHIIDTTKPAGGGGTRVGALREYLAKQRIEPTCIVIFTDGYVESDWGGNNWPAPVMWCITTKGLTAPTGKSMYVEV